MRFFLISDNADTEVGLRLAGIEGVVVPDAAGAEDALHKAVADETVGIVLITARLSAQCRDTLIRTKKAHPRTLIVEIPDRHGGGADSLEEYVRNAVGIKL